MITANVIHRVFCLGFPNHHGTGFTVDWGGKQYLITAKHLVKDIKEKDTLNIFHENKWKPIDISLVGHCDEGVDISVLATNDQLSPPHPMEPSSGGLGYGQDVYFLGFPYSDGSSLSKINRNFPLPFVKKAIISCFRSLKPETMMATDRIFLDGHNNPGFSGGPVVFKERGKKEYKVAAVISGHMHRNEPVYQGKEKTNLEYQANTGIIISYSIEPAVAIIKSNPIGAPIQT